MTKQGAMQAVNDYGGRETLSKGLDFARNTPMVAKAVAMLGFDIKQLEGLADDILNDKTSSQYNSFKSTPKGTTRPTDTGLKDRLRRKL